MQVGNLKNKRKKGFTLVELLIVVIVIGILASIAIVSYNGTQKRARDSKRLNDISEITKALEVYYSVNHKYPTGGGASIINNTWSASGDSSWDAFEAALGPYMDNNVPSDPINTPPPADPLVAVGYDYAYYSTSSSWCGAAGNQYYILVYRLEASPQTNTLIGNCPTNPLGPFPLQFTSNYRVTRL